MNAHDYASSLHQLADFYEAHPDLPVPQAASDVYVYTDRDGFNAARQARAGWNLHRVPGEADELHYQFGDISLIVFTHDIDSYDEEFSVLGGEA